MSPILLPVFYFPSVERVLNHFAVALEEAIQLPETASQAAHYAKPGTGSGLAEMLLDIHGERLDLMNQYNIEHFVLVFARLHLQY